MKEILEALNKAVEAGTITAEEVESLKGKFEESYIKKDSLTESYISKDEFNDKLKARLDREKNKYKLELEEWEEAKPKLEKLEDYQTQLEAATAKLQGYEKAEKEKTFKDTLEAKIKEELGDTELKGIYRELLEFKIGDKFDDEDLISSTVKEIATKFKEENPVHFGGSTSTNTTVDYSKLTTGELLKLAQQ